MAVCLFCPFVCLLAGLHKYYWLELYEKNQRMGCGSSYIPSNFESDLSHCLDTNNNPDFPVYLLLCALAEYCNLQVSMMDIKLTTLSNIVLTGTCFQAMLFELLSKKL